MDTPNYLQARAYLTDHEGVSQLHTTGTVTEVRAAVQQITERLGVPRRYSMVEHLHADVVSIEFEDARLRVVFDKRVNYELIHCPSCGRQKLPPDVTGPVECSHGWHPEWKFDDANDIWRCNTISRHLVSKEAHHGST